MGAGGSTASRTDSTIRVVPRRSQSNSDTRIHHQHHHPSTTSSARSLQDHRPTDSCCCHHRENHAGMTRTVTPHDVTPSDSIDDEIEEIVANTLDIVSRHQSATTGVPQRVYDTSRSDDSLKSAGRRQNSRTVTVASHGERTRMRRNSSSSAEQVTDHSTQPIAKDTLPEVDFAKFRKVNHQHSESSICSTMRQIDRRGRCPFNLHTFQGHFKSPIPRIKLVSLHPAFGATIQRNGKVLHHQESDLLWRLGLISPEAYTITKTTKSAPNSQGDYLKTPSYDLTEEQLMANIEKEFTGCAGAN